MIDDAKARENNVFAKFQQYDADGSGAIDEVSANNNKKIGKCQKLKKLKQRIRLSRPVRQEIRLHAHAHTHNAVATERQSIEKVPANPTPLSKGGEFHSLSFFQERPQLIFAFMHSLSEST